MGELGLQELLSRFDKLDRAVDENVERVADHVVQLGTKVDSIAEAAARLEGTLEAHIASEDSWRRDVSEKINAVDYQARTHAKEAKEEAVKVATEAKTLAEAASKVKSDWAVRWQTAVVLVGLVATVLGGLAAYAKITEAKAQPAPYIQSTASRPSR